MKIVIFGLTVSSSWGNGHATLWRGLIKALGARGHDVVFFEKDVEYYAAHRDIEKIPGGRLILYREWESVLAQAQGETDNAEVAMVTSYCPDALAATALILNSSAELRVFYDLDAPVTLDRLKEGTGVDYIGTAGLRDFDLVLSYTGGVALEELQAVLGARRVAPIYGSVDPDIHSPAASEPRYVCDFSYLGTYARDRQAALETLFIEPARQMAFARFLIGGAQYPESFPWNPNIYFARHVPPAEHPAFYSSSKLTLNITRAAMARMGFCPSGRLFEAASCGVPIVSDTWEGLGSFFEPGKEIIVAQTSQDVIDALKKDHEELTAIARAARERTLAEHTATQRVVDMEKAFEAAASGNPALQAVTTDHQAGSN